MAKAQTTKPLKAVKATKATKATTKAVKVPKSVVTKKSVAATKPKNKPNQKKSSYQPLKGISHAFVDFKDKSLEESIVQWGGTITRSIKTADSLVCEDFNSEKAMTAICKYEKQDYIVNKEDLEDQIADFEIRNEKTFPKLSIGKKTLEMRVNWFTELGQPIGLHGIAPVFNAGADVSVVSNSENEYYDTCYHSDGGNTSDLFTQLCRLQLTYDATKQEFYVITFSAYLNDIQNESETCIQSRSCLSTKEEAITAFESEFRDAMGYTWKNRMTCKPKKGLGLIADLENFKK